MGYAQHDSHELLGFLLDGIHEDLNRVKDKKMVEKVEKGNDEIPDYVVAKKAWEAHLLRNDSIIQDLMGG